MNIRTTLLIFMLAVTITACGRRGDPVLVEPSIRKDVGREAGEKDIKGPIPAEQTQSELLKDIDGAPVVPSGLNGIYTQQSVILTWDYIDDPKLKYNVYRSKGNGFEFVGESVTPVYTDRNVEAGVKYHYRVTAVGDSEGTPSDEIIIITEIH